jgi:hypothetical protein
MVLPTWKIEFLDCLCDASQASQLLGIHVPGGREDDALGDEEIDFEDDLSTLFTGSESETQTFTFTNDGSTTITGQYAANRPTSDQDSVTQNTIRKTTRLFDAIEQKYWNLVSTFLATGRWDTSQQPHHNNSRMPSHTILLKEEARQWSVTLDKSGKVITRCLPIHAATMRQPPLDVIVQLVDLNPNGVSCADSLGNLPLHLAFKYGADDRVIDYLLRGYPGAVLVKNNSTVGKGGKGLLPMECGDKLKQHAMIRLCQDKARELSYENVKNDFDAASNPKANVKRKARIHPTNRDTVATALDQQEEDLMKIQRELDELRRSKKHGGSLTESTIMDTWMRNTLKGTFLENAMARGLPQEEALPVIQESNSLVSENGGSDTNKAAKPTSARWNMPSFRRLVSVDDDDDGDDNTMGGESFEVKLTSQSMPTGSTNKKRFPFVNPFRKSSKKNAKWLDGGTYCQQIDTVTVQSSSSKANLSVSRFSLSGFKDDNVPLKSKPSGGASESAKSVPDSWSPKFPSSSPRSAALAPRKRFLQKRTWLHQKPKQVEDTSKLPARLESVPEKKQDANSKPRPIVVAESPPRTPPAPTGKEHVSSTKDDDQKLKTESNPGVLSSWNIDQSGLAQAVSNFMMNSVPTQTDVRSQHNPSKTLESTESVSESLVVSAHGGKKSFTNPFLMRKQHSFLENALLVASTSASGTSSKPSVEGGRGLSFRRKLKPVSPAEATTSDKDDDYAEEEDEDEDDSFARTDGDSSTRSYSESSQSSSSVIMSSDSEEAGGDRLESSPPAQEKSQSTGFTWPGSRTSRKTVTRKLSKRIRKAEKKEKKKNKKQKNSSVASSDDERRKSKFALFRGKKARGDNSMSNDAAIAELSNGFAAAKGNENAPLARMRSHTDEAANGAARASHLAKTLSQASDPNVLPRDMRQGSGGSRRSSRSPGTVEGCVVMPILPQKGDWREEYQNYLSSTQSTRNGHRGKSAPDRPGIETTKKSNSIRDVMKTSRRRDHGKTSVLYQETKQAPSSGAEDILSDLERVSPLALDSSKSIPRRRPIITKRARVGIVKDTSSTSTGPVVSESTVESSDTGNVYLVRVQF